MGKYMAALYSNGRMVTGLNHGDAFSKLSCSEKDGDIESGFFDPATGRFFTDTYDFYMKQIFLIRHGESDGSMPDSDLTEMGMLQVRKTAEYLFQQFDLAEYEAITSPYLRCRHSAQIISEVTGLKFCTDRQICERHDEDDTQFIARIDNSLSCSPAKAIYITHSDFIVNFTERAIGKKITECESMPGGALTFIDARRLVCCGKICYCAEESKSNVL